MQPLHRVDWRAVKTLDGTEIQESGDEGIVCLVSPGEREDQRAQLIEHAPEMLRELKRYLRNGDSLDLRRDIEHLVALVERQR